MSTRSVCPAAPHIFLGRASAPFLGNECPFGCPWPLLSVGKMAGAIKFALCQSKTSTPQLRKRIRFGSSIRRPVTLNATNYTQHLLNTSIGSKIFTTWSFGGHETEKKLCY